MKHPIPEAALRESVAIVGRTGSGKSYAARGAVELLLAEQGAHDLGGSIRRQVGRPDEREQRRDQQQRRRQQQRRLGKVARQTVELVDLARSPIRTGVAAEMGMGPHHSQALESWVGHVPGLKVVQPATAYDAKGLIKSAIRDNDPVVFLESEKMYGDKGEVPEGEYIIPIGVADIKRKGTDITLVTFGKIIKVAQEAAEALAKENISVEIIDLRTIRPLDYGTIVESIKKTNRCVVVEESWPLASISSEIAYHLQRYAFDYLDAPVQRVTQTDTPFAFSPTLIDEALPNVERIVKAVKATLYR